MVSHTRDLKESNLKMMVSQGCKLIESARHSYFMKIGQTLSNADTGQKNPLVTNKQSFELSSGSGNSSPFRKCHSYPGFLNKGINL